jgi:hypothetical protein
MPLDLTAITAAVQRNSDAEASAIALIQDIAARLEAAKGDPVAIQALADALNAKADELGAAVVANTPAA